MNRNAARRGEPYAWLGLIHDMLEGARKVFEPVRPADDVGMQRDAHDQRTLFAFLLHHVEGVDDHVGEFGAFALACDDLRNVIELLRIRYDKMRPRRVFIQTGWSSWHQSSR